MRLAIVLVLLAAVALAGCADQAEDLAEAGGPGGADGGAQGSDQADGNGTDEGDQGNETGSGDDGSRDQGSGDNGTQEDSEGNATDDGGDEKDPGWPEPSEAAVRPGSPVLDGTCTANFVFRSPDNSTLYVGTAAHCLTNAEVGDRVPMGNGEATGVVAWDSFAAMDRVDESSDAARTFNDFALIEVDPGSRSEVHPAARVYGGPAGSTSDAGTGDRVLTYGASNLRPATDALDPREGYVVASSEWHVDVYFTGSSVFGDSGSPVLTADGQALAEVITVEVYPGTASNDATKITRAEAYMEKHGGPQVELVNWSQFSDGQLPG